MAHLTKVYPVSERRACRVLRLPRSSYRHVSPLEQTRVQVRTRINELSHRYPRYGYRKVHWLLRREGVEVGRESVRLTRLRDGLKVARKQIRRRRLGTSSSVVKEAQYPQHVWSYDFVHDATADGRSLRCLTVVDEFTRRCLAIVVRRSFTSRDVTDVLSKLIAVHGRPTCLRSDNGTEFVAKHVQEWLTAKGISTRYIEPGHPWQNGANESFNGIFRDGCLDRCLFLNLSDAREQIETYRLEYNDIRPHGSLNGRAPSQFFEDWEGAQTQRPAAA